jgi:hypothetical protein
MKYVLECTAFALSPPCWATQRTIGVPSITHNERLRYTWDSPGAAESQRPLYEAALNYTFQVVLIP